MYRSRLSVVCVLLLAIVTLLTACASDPVDPTASMSPEQIYAQAKEELEMAAYDKAVSLFEKLEARAAGTPLAQQAQLDKAYTHYKAQEPAQAIATLERFIKLHPSSPALDYALYLKGLVNYNEDRGMLAFLGSQDLSERDQKAAKESFAAFRELVVRFPQSRYTPDARAHMAQTINSLARYEIHVARYYLSRRAYLAAVNRAQIALTDYPGSPSTEDALTILVKAYDALNLPQLRDDALRVLKKNFPRSEALSQDVTQDRATRS